jgi:hypothetical protein
VKKLLSELCEVASLASSTLKLPETSDIMKMELQIKGKYEQEKY